MEDRTEFRIEKKFLAALQGIEDALIRIADKGDQQNGNGEILQKLEKLGEQMANTRQDVLDQLETVKAEVGKIGDDLASFVAELQAAIAAGQDLSDIVASVSDVATRLQAVDDTIPERPTPPAA